MKRKDFLKGTGLAGIGLFLPKIQASPKVVEKQDLTDCVLIPSETAGPFPLDLTANTAFLRQDIREDREGAQLHLKLKIKGAEDCEAMQNVRVNIWQCDKDGQYSGYNSQQGLTYLRGYQMTDVNGEVEFTTVLPGWYPGRTCHIHFQVYVSETYAAISQLTFDHSTVNNIYSNFFILYTKGPDPLNPMVDGVFADGYALQLASLAPIPGSMAYESFLEVTVQGAGSVGVSNRERQTAKVFTLSQNAPNPFYRETIVPVEVKEKSDIKLELYDVNGQLVAKVFELQNAYGKYRIKIDLLEWGLPSGNYLYQLEAINKTGVYRSVKLMTWHQQ